MKYDGREWENDELLKKFRYNSGIIFDYKMALENYTDLRGENINEFNELDHYWYGIKNNSQNFPEEELYNISCKVLADYKNIVAKLDQKYFTYYDDGGIEFNF